MGVDADARTVVAVLLSQDEPSSSFWQGTGSAIVGAGLSGLVAVGAAFLAAWLARRHDRGQEARQAAARIDALAYEVWQDLVVIADQDDYPTFAAYRIFELRRAIVRELAYLSEAAALYIQLKQIIAWVNEVWLPELRRTVIRLPPLGPDEDLDPRVEALSMAGADAISEVNTALQVWLARGKVFDLEPFPDLDDLPSADQSDRTQGGTPPDRPR
jgi:hypothetical protein